MTEHRNALEQGRIRLAKLNEEQSKKPERHRETLEEFQERHRQRQASIRLAAGLSRLKEGKACTSAQAPYVGEYIKGYEQRIEGLEKQLKDARIDAARDQDFVQQIAEDWNAIISMFRELGIDHYHHATRFWCWEAEHQGKQGSGELYATADEALKAAIEWRINS
jgi:hypothetical protein